MTYKAIVKYALDDRPGEKRDQILDGLVECAHELADLGMSKDDIDREFEAAMNQFLADTEHDA